MCSACVPPCAATACSHTLAYLACVQVRECACSLGVYATPPGLIRPSSRCALLWVVPCVHALHFQASKAGAWRLAKRALVPVRPPAAAGAGETWHATTAVSKVTWHATAELEGCPPCAAPGAPPAMDAAAPAALAEASLLPAGGGAAAQWTADHPLPGEGAPPPP
eukprot:CAMPEP_0202358454 /NCGR_PEP_ID=MMETSP1126-20121109/12115_1 /ASSEMBLY_ACC=CAM_ASM_000457 /TAXON_ID=3047 /ORGANISM="Dunaliella tertiolecta, Strain CCMP1320" /LENGTH=164 /DNA_ID=CAMNT_0048951619 /DNA_START=206 /DNA_END=700 /DNA_ORIENTATION=+